MIKIDKAFIRIYFNNLKTFKTHQNHKIQHFQNNLLFVLHTIHGCNIVKTARKIKILTLPRCILLRSLICRFPSCNFETRLHEMLKCCRITKRYETNWQKREVPPSPSKPLLSDASMSHQLFASTAAIKWQKCSKLEMRSFAFAHWNLSFLWVPLDLTNFNTAWAAVLWLQWAEIYTSTI